MRTIDRLSRLTVDGDLDAARALYRLAARGGLREAQKLAGNVLVEAGEWALEAAVRTSLGRHRAFNGDAYCVAVPLGRFMVADGMGSPSPEADLEAEGNLAARLLVASLAQAEGPIGDFDVQSLWRPGIVAPSPSDDEVLSLLERVHQAYRSAAVARSGLRAAVATFALLSFHLRHVLIAHVGDVRAYRLRVGQLQCLTQDHTLFNSLVQEGRLDPAEADRSLYPDMLVRAFGANANALVVDVQRSDIRYDDLYLVCSDGLYRHLDEAFVEGLLARGGWPLARCCGALVDEANQRGGRDNATAILVRVGAAA